MGWVTNGPSGNPPIIPKSLDTILDAILGITNGSKDMKIKPPKAPEKQKPLLDNNTWVRVNTNSAYYENHKKKIGIIMGNNGGEYTVYFLNQEKVVVFQPNNVTAQAMTEKKKITQKKEGETLEIKIGDAVKVIGKFSNQSLEIGDIGVVKQINRYENLPGAVFVGAVGTVPNNIPVTPNTITVFFIVRNSDGLGQWLYKEEFSVGKRNLSKLELWDSIIMSDDHRNAIEEALAQTTAENSKKLFEDWGFGSVLEKGRGVHMLFYGPPGTGKTLTAEAIALRLGQKMIIVQTAEVESMEPGGCERAIKGFFAEAKKVKAVLVFDECDSLIYDRTRIGAIMGAQVNCLLSEMERHDGVCVYTTNNTPALDKAFERRLALKLEFPAPTIDMRFKIWKRMFKNPNILDETVNLKELSTWKLTGGEIKNIVLNAARKAVYEKKEKISQGDLLKALERESKGKTAFAEATHFHQTGMTAGYDMGATIEKRKGVDNVSA